MLHKEDFVHLHVHTDYSLSGSTIQIKPLAKRLDELGMRACAITDDNLSGSVYFDNLMSAYGIKPIIGCEISIASGSNRNKRDGSNGQPSGHMVLLVKNIEGYKTLVRLTSKAFAEGFDQKLPIDRDLLSQFSHGLIGLSGGLLGLPEKYLKDGDMASAQTAAEEFQEILGKGNYFLEIQAHGLSDQLTFNRTLIELSKRSGISLVATADAHYLTREDLEAHDLMIEIVNGSTPKNTDRKRVADPHCYLRSGKEMHQIFTYVPDAVTRTLEIAEMCDFKFPRNVFHWPTYKRANEGGNTSIDEYFERMVWEGFKKRRTCVWEPRQAQRQLNHSLSQYRERVSREIDEIKRMGFADYLLIVWDFIKFAREKKIPVGPGSGSVTGSLIAYCLEITDVDPLRYDLLFERFLNPQRISLPDIDTYFCVHGRDEVMKYVVDRHGHDSAARMIDFEKFESKELIKEVARGLDVPYSDIERVVKLIPSPKYKYSRNVTIDQAVETVPELRQTFASDAQVNKVIDLALRLEGCIRHRSVYSATLTISPQPLVELVPVTLSEGHLITQFEEPDLEKVGIISFDFIASDTLSIVDQCCRTMRETSGREIVWSEVSLDDPKTYEFLATGRLEGVIHSDYQGKQDACRKLRPRSFEHLVALEALYRPGAIEAGLLDEYIGRLHGGQAIEYVAPELSEILKTTYGLLLYQEQIMHIAENLGNYTLGEADLLRRALARRKREEVTVHEQKFVAGCISNKISRAKAQEIFRYMTQQADYLFPRAFCVPFSLITFQTAYLKAHYPEHFYSALITHGRDRTGPPLWVYANQRYSEWIGRTASASQSSRAQLELRSQGIRVLPPDINESTGEFLRPCDGAIRYGLSAIKGVTKEVIDAIVVAREGRKFDSVYDFAERVGREVWDIRLLESLVWAGGFDSLKPEKETLCQWRAESCRTVERALRSLANSTVVHESVAETSGVNQLPGPINTEPSANLESSGSWENKELLAKEKSTLGFYVSAHPLDEFNHKIEKLNCTDLGQLWSTESIGPIRVAGVVFDFTLKRTKRGDPYAFFRLEDSSGISAKCVLWPEVFKKKGRDAANDAVVVVVGSTETSSHLIICDEVILVEKAMIPSTAVGFSKS
jgi:DNA polymerase III subunit alpha